MIDQAKYDLRRKIAEATGWRVEVLAPGLPDEDGFVTWARLYNPAGVCVFTCKKLEDAIIRYEAGYVWQQAFARRGLIPDWENETGPALMLCLSIAAGKWDTSVSHEPTEPEGIRYTAYFNSIYYSELDWNDKMCYHCWHPYAEEGATPAEALARLALSALEATTENTK